MNSPHRHERNKQAEKQGQATLSDWNGGVIEQGHRKVIEPAYEQRRGYEYIKENLIDSVQQPLGEAKPYHKGHRYLFLFRYEGVQPIYNADSVGSWGRYGTVKQARYNYHEDKAIVFTLPHTIKVWITHPKGERTVKELAEARKSAWRVAESFSRKHGIAITGEKEAGFSEHTVEDKALDKVIRPLPMEEPELAKERLGLSINQTSHKNKVEWTGKPAKERVMALERLLDTDILGKIDTIEQGIGAIAEGQERIIRRLARPRKPKMRIGPAKPYDIDGRDYR